MSYRIAIASHREARFYFPAICLRRRVAPRLFRFPVSPPPPPAASLVLARFKGDREMLRDREADARADRRCLPCPVDLINEETPPGRYPRWKLTDGRAPRAFPDERGVSRRTLGLVTRETVTNYRYVCAPSWVRLRLIFETRAPSFSFSPSFPRTARRRPLSRNEKADPSPARETHFTAGRFVKTRRYRVTVTD